MGPASPSPARAREHGPSRATSGVIGITARVVACKVISGMSAGGVTVITARSLGPDGRGAFVLLFTLATITYLLCTFGVNTGARDHVPARANSHPHPVRHVPGGRHAATVLLLAEVGVTVFHLDAFSLTGLNGIGLAASAAVVGLLVVVLADLVLVPAFDIRGAAWGSVMSFSMMGLTVSLLLTRSTRSHAVPG